MESSSFININGDLKQTKLSILIYLFFNLLQNVYYSIFPKQFKYLNLNPKKRSYLFKEHHSISRKLCSIFWKNIDWKNLKSTIGKFNICEIGPGDGSYFKNDIQIKKKYIKKYYGYDVAYHKKWENNKNKKFSYKKFNGKNFKKIISKSNNLFLSQSCLEHVKYDLEFIKEVVKSSKKSKKKALMMHCVPSPFCLFTYLTHGYRQYNVANINKFSKIIGYENLFVTKLGGLQFNIDHLRKTTIPLIFKNKNLMLKQNKDYYKKLNSKLIKKQNSSLFGCSFLVIIGFLNFNNQEKNFALKKIFY